MARWIRLSRGCVLCEYGGDGDGAATRRQTPIMENFGYSNIHGTYVVRLPRTGGRSQLLPSLGAAEINTMALMPSGAFDWRRFSDVQRLHLPSGRTAMIRRVPRIEFVEGFTKVKENAGVVTLKPAGIGGPMGRRRPRTRRRDRHGGCALHGGERDGFVRQWGDRKIDHHHIA